MKKCINVDSYVCANTNTNTPVMDNTVSKKIIMVGTANRYQMKKLTEKKELPKNRVLVKQWNLDSVYFTHEKQLHLLEHDSKDFPLIYKEIERKIQGYKHQDMDKKIIIDHTKIVSLQSVISMLLDSRMTCHYCRNKVFILYELVRENAQWTLDRIDNRLGHNIDNIVISCLQCNLKRRCCDKDKFLMTKQLKIVQGEKV